MIRGRTDDRLIIRGVNVYPSQIEAVLARLPELSPHVRIVSHVTTISITSKGTVR